MFSPKRIFFSSVQTSPPVSPLSEHHVRVNRRLQTTFSSHKVLASSQLCSVCILRRYTDWSIYCVERVFKSPRTSLQVLSVQPTFLSLLAARAALLLCLAKILNFLASRFTRTAQSHTAALMDVQSTQPRHGKHTAQPWVTTNRPMALSYREASSTRRGFVHKHNNYPAVVMLNFYYYYYYFLDSEVNYRYKYAVYKWS